VTRTRVVRRFAPANEPPRLPEWYLPQPMRGVRLSGWRRRVAVLIVAAFIAINAYGLCSTYGWIELA
jgi:hypothetical protein